MSNGNGRVRKIADRIRVVVAEMLERRIKDARLGFVTVTDVRVTGDTAIVNGVAAVNVIDTGKDLKIKIRYTTIHANRGGSWQLRAWQATRFPQ